MNQSIIKIGSDSRVVPEEDEIVEEEDLIDVKSDDDLLLKSFHLEQREDVVSLDKADLRGALADPVGAKYRPDPTPFKRRRSSNFED